MNKKNALDCVGDFEIRRLTEKTDVSNFKADGGDIYTTFLVQNAKNCDAKKITTTYLVFHKGDNERVCAYFSLLFHSISAEKLKKIPMYIYNVGAIEIYQLAASYDFAQEYCHIVDFIIQVVVAKALTVCKQHINVRFITVHADPEQGNKDIVKIYKKAGFTELELNPDEESPETVFMMYDIGDTPVSANA